MTVTTAILKKILDALPSLTDKGLSVKPRFEKRFQENSKASPMFIMATIVTGYPGIRECLNGRLPGNEGGVIVGNLKMIRLNAEIHTAKIVEGKDRTIFNKKGRSLNRPFSLCIQCGQGVITLQ